jgi:hypothetical protein
MCTLKGIRSLNTFEERLLRRKKPQGDILISSIRFSTRSANSLRLFRFLFGKWYRQNFISASDERVRTMRQYLSSSV